MKPQYVPTTLHGCPLYPDVHDRNLYSGVSGGVPQALLANITILWHLPRET